MYAAIEKINILKYEWPRQSSLRTSGRLLPAGCTVFYRFRPLTGTRSFFAGAVLAILSFLFSCSYGLVPGTILVSIAGLLLLVNWQKQNGK